MSKIDLFDDPGYKIEIVPQKDSMNNVIGYDILINGQRTEDLDPSVIESDKKLQKILGMNND